MQEIVSVYVPRVVTLSAISVTLTNTSAREHDILRVNVCTIVESLLFFYVQKSPIAIWYYDVFHFCLNS